VTGDDPAWSLSVAAAVQLARDPTTVTLGDVMRAMEVSGPPRSPDGASRRRCSARRRAGSWSCPAQSEAGDADGAPLDEPPMFLSGYEAGPPGRRRPPTPSRPAAARIALLVNLRVSCRCSDWGGPRRVGPWCPVSGDAHGVSHDMHIAQVILLGHVEGPSRDHRCPRRRPLTGRGRPRLRGLPALDQPTDGPLPHRGRGRVRAPVAASALVTATARSSVADELNGAAGSARPTASSGAA
jgi:hypothetical protein